MTEQRMDRNAVDDSCPSWADRLIRQIHELEVKLGNIRNPQEQWSTDDYDALASRAFEAEDLATADDTVEALFVRVAHGLSGEGFDASTIARFVNARVGFGGRLPYCDAREVAEALSQTLH